MSEIKYYNNAWGAAKAEFVIKKIPAACILVIASGKKEADMIYNDLLFFNNGKKILYFPEYDHEPFEEVRINPDIYSSRAKTLECLINSSGTEELIIVSTPYSLMKKITPVDVFKSNITVFSRGDIAQRDELSVLLDRLGYLPVEVVTGEGEFCFRGGILDIYPVNSSYPVRVEFFDDEIEYVFSYDLNTQKRVGDLDSFTLLPASEIVATPDDLLKLDLPSKIIEKINSFGKFAGYHWLVNKVYNAENLFNYLPSGVHIVMQEEEWAYILERVSVSIADRAVDTVFPEPLESFMSYLAVKHYIESREVSIISDLVSSDKAESCRYKSIKSRFSLKKGNLYYDLTQALNEINIMQGDGYTTVACVESGRFINLLEKFCVDHEIKLAEINYAAEAKKGSLCLYKDRVSGGFINEKDKFVLITDEEIFGFVRKRNKTRTKDVFDTAISDLEKGDYIVHVDYGIGVYEGLKHMEMGGIEGDYLEIVYESSEKLFVPLERISQIQKYVGIGDSKPRLSNLSTNTWSKLKASARKQASKIAQDLLKLYAERKTRKGFAFNEAGDMLESFEENFEFDETEDQIAAIADVYSDMEKDTPMERLICGDVGYGKTEIAMRASCKAVMSSKQVAVLVPTTVLARQHFNTFSRRFAGFPVTVEYISRMRTAKEIKLIKERLQNGEIDILIGTHRILSEDIQFNDLRLLVVDEEQRFGVAHKEKIAAMRSNIDVLSLSATPIPRTLQLSLSGIREISVIETPPSNRMPVSVSVIQNGDDVRKAMMRELERNGQIFFLHNRIQDLCGVVEYVKSLVPHARIASAHGRTSPADLEKILVDFYNGEIDILVSTSIIENGIDIPNVNAIFIDKAENFGLSQLYQLKGRVGRSSTRGYCYLLVDNMAGLTSIARKRLSIIQQLSDLGSGLKIAMYDLQLRGAGDILGAAQSGFVTKVGYELFIKMIAEAVAELQKVENIHMETEIITQFPYYMAADYIDDPKIRLDYYRVFSSLADRYAMEELFMELEKLYGEVRRETVNLGYIMLIKNLCSCLKISKAGVYPKMIRLTFTSESPVDPAFLRSEAEKRNLHFRFAGGYEFILSFDDADKTLALTEDFLGILCKEFITQGV